MIKFYLMKQDELNFGIKELKNLTHSIRVTFKQILLQDNNWERYKEVKKGG